MEILFDTIKPYLRFVRYLTLTAGSPRYADSTYTYIPYDARLFYTIDGDGIIDANGNAYPMQKNSLIIINSGVPYHFCPPEGTVSYLAINFDFTYTASDKKVPIPPDTVGNYNSSNLINQVTFSDVTELNEVFYISDIPSIEKRIISIEKEYARKINMYELRISSLLTDILIRCIRHIALPTHSTNEPELANKIVDYIQENYNTSLSNQEIADLFHYHPNYISTLLKRHTGFSLHQYITNICVTKAIDMLMDSKKSIQDIAVACGFYDSSHFIRCFKAHVGMTPTQYQNLYHQDE